MDVILIGYVGLMAMGLLWVLYRIVVFVRNQRDMDRRWGGEISEAEFAAFIEEFKRNNPKRETGTNPERPGGLQGSAGSAMAPSPTVSAPRPLDTE